MPPHNRMPLQTKAWKKGPESTIMDSGPFVFDWISGVERRCQIRCRFPITGVPVRIAGGFRRTAGDLRQGVKAGLQVRIGGDVVGHRLLHEGGIGRHIEIAGAGQAEQDGLFLAGFLALERFVDRHADRMGGFRRRQDGLHAANSTAASKTLVCSTERASSIQPS